MYTTGMYVGIDIGGTKTLLATLSAQGEILETKRFPTDENYEQFLADLRDNFAQLQTTKPFHCCVGVPGLLDREAGIVHSLGNLPWRDKPIKHDIAAIVDQPVIIENDARMAGLSEAQLVKTTHDTVLFETVSTGIGGAVIQNGRIVEVLRDIETGKMPLFHNGKFIDWEDFASGRNVVERYHKQAYQITDPAQWHEIGELLAYGLGPVCAIIQPEIIILGGSIGKHADKYSDVIADWLDANLHPNVRRPQKIIAAQRADDAVIYGCYDLLKQVLGNA